MNVAVDADSLPLSARADAPARGASNDPDLTVYTFSLIRALQSAESPVDRVLVLTHPENHGRFEALRDDRTDVVRVPRPLFEGRPVADWAALLDHHPRLGADLLAAHHQATLRLLHQLGAHVLHFPADARERMEIDFPLAVTIHHGRPSLSASLADAVIVHTVDLLPHFPPAKTFLASFPSIAGARDADNVREPACAADLLASLSEAYEHALASFELRKAA
jgi:hypothetical protein